MFVLLVLLLFNVKEFSKGVVTVPSKNHPGMFNLKYVNKANRRILKMRGLTAKAALLDDSEIGTSVAEDLRVEVSGVVNVSQHDYGYLIHLKSVSDSPDAQDIFTPMIPQPYVCNGVFTDVPAVPHRRTFDPLGTLLCIGVSILITFGTTAAYPLLFSMDKKLDKILIALGIKEGPEDDGVEVGAINEATDDVTIRDFLRRKKELERTQCITNEQIYMIVALIVAIFTGMLSANTMLVELGWPRIMKIVPTAKCYVVGNYEDIFKTNNYTTEQKNAIIGPIKAQLKAARMRDAIIRKAKAVNLRGNMTYHLLERFSDDGFIDKRQVSKAVKTLSESDYNYMDFLSDIETYADEEEALEVESMTAKKEMVRAHFHTRCGVSIKTFTPNRVTYTYNTKLKIHRTPVQISLIDEVRVKYSAYCKVGQSSGIKDKQWENNPDFTPMRQEPVSMEWGVGCGIGGCFGCRRKGEIRVGWRWSTAHWQHVRADFSNPESLIRSAQGEGEVVIDKNDVFWNATTHTNLIGERHTSGWYQNLTYTILPDPMTGSYENSKGSNIVFSADENEVRDAVMNNMVFETCPGDKMELCPHKGTNFDTFFTQPTNNTCTVDLYMDIPAAESGYKWTEWAEPCQKVLATTLEGDTNIQISTDSNYFCSVNVTYYGGEENMIVIASGIPYSNPGIVGWSCVDAGDGWGTDCGKEAMTEVDPMIRASNFTTYVNSTWYPAKNWELPSLFDILGLDELMYAGLSIAGIALSGGVAVIIAKFVVPAITRALLKRRVQKKAAREASERIAAIEQEIEQKKMEANEEEDEECDNGEYGNRDKSKI